MAATGGTIESCRWNMLRRSVLCWMLALCFACFTISRWIIWPVQISGDSMVPSYFDGQANYINKLAYWNEAPRRGDVVGLRVRADEVQIKRIIGLPGERLDFDRGTVVIDGQPLDEPYVDKELLWRLSSVQLGPDEYFVMGDNRQLSRLGPVPGDWIIGKVMF